MVSHSQWVDYLKTIVSLSYPFSPSPVHTLDLQLRFGERAFFRKFTNMVPFA